jgi:hypothetical protein
VFMMAVAYFISDEPTLRFEENIACRIRRIKVTRLQSFRLPRLGLSVIRTKRSYLTISLARDGENM